MTITDYPGGVSSYGQVVTPAAGIAPGGDIFWLDPTNGSDGYDGKTPGRAFATLAKALAACTANQHDTVFYIPGSSGLNLSAAVDWNKNYTHLVGLAAPSRFAQRSRFFQLSTLTGASPLLTISATGCHFRNFYIFQGVNDATSLINVSVTGGRNHFSNVHFAGGGHAAQAINGGASLKLDGAEENTFDRCTMGVDTAEATDGYSTILFDGSAHRNTFKDCIIQAYPAAGQTGVALVELADVAACDRLNYFEGCLFWANSTNKAVTLASAFVIPAGHTTTATIYIDPNCRLIGATDWDASDRGILYIASGAITAGGNAGIAQPSAAT